MISLSDLQKDWPVYFTTDGKDVWILDGFFDVPSCTLKNLQNSEKSTFGLNGIMANDFHRIEMPKQALKENEK